jgi:P4 family phage/plasmid primase-like protien
MTIDDRDSYREDIDSLNGIAGGSGIDADATDNPTAPVPKNHLKENNTSRETIANLTNTLMDMHNFATIMDTEEIYCYDEILGIFVNNGEAIIKLQVEAICSTISDKEVKEIIGHISRRTPTEREEFDSQVEWFACKNCMVNLKTLETKQHSPDFMATVQIPVKYQDQTSTIANFFNWVEDGDVKYYYSPCPAIMKFMYEVMAPDDVETVLDFIAYCLWRSLSFHRYLLFNGSGRNGKGVMLEVIKRFLGYINVSGESLHRLLENRFATAELYGKLANIDADMSKEALKNTGILKKLTGGDYIAAEKKFQPPFKFVNYAKLIFSANQIPITPDETDAFFSRLIIINFPNQFLGDKADPYLIDKLATEQDLSGLLEVVLRRFTRVLQKGIYVFNGTIEQNYDKYIQSSNPIRAFVEVSLEKDIGSEEKKEDVYKAFKMFCKSSNGIRTIVQQKVEKRVWIKLCPKER